MTSATHGCRVRSGPEPQSDEQSVGQVNLVDSRTALAAEATRELEAELGGRVRGEVRFDTGAAPILGRDAAPAWAAQQLLPKIIVASAQGGRARPLSPQ